MAKENSQKIKLLKLMELLRQETDEQHPMAATVVCQKLNDMEVACDRRTLTRDIQALNDYGYEVMTTMISHEKAYYVEDRSFSVPELKILIDSVQADSFVTDKKTAELIEKIANLGGSHSADILQSNMVCFNTRKHHNESIYYNVDYLEDAIEQKKKVIFYYFDLNENGEKVYRNGHHHYVVEPIALVFNEDNYYMVCYSARHDSTANYRIDRMDAVEVIDEGICEKAIELWYRAKWKDAKRQRNRQSETANTVASTHSAGCWSAANAVISCAAMYAGSAAVKQYPLGAAATEYPTAEMCATVTM